MENHYNEIKTSNEQDMYNQLQDVIVDYLDDLKVIDPEKHLELSYLLKDEEYKKLFEKKISEMSFFISAVMLLNVGYQEDAELERMAEKTVYMNLEKDDKQIRQMKVFFSQNLNANYLEEQGILTTDEEKDAFTKRIRTFLMGYNSRLKKLGII